MYVHCIISEIYDPAIISIKKSKNTKIAADEMTTKFIARFRFLCEQIFSARKSLSAGKIRQKSVAKKV